MLEVNEVTATCNSSEEAHKIKTRTCCSDCVNKVICKYTDQYIDYTSQLESADLPDFIKVEISCRYHKQIHYNLKSNKPVVSISGRDTISNPSTLQVKHTKHAGVAVLDSH